MADHLLGQDLDYAPCLECQRVMAAGVTLVEIHTTEVVEGQKGVRMPDGETVVYPSGPWAVADVQWARSVLDHRKLATALQEGGIVFVSREVWGALDLPDPDADRPTPS